jgi:hypothetical protein
MVMHSLDFKAKTEEQETHLTFNVNNKDDNSLYNKS